MAPEKGAKVLVPLSDPMALENVEKIGKLSMQHRSPVISSFREIIEAGGVLGFGPDLSTLFRPLSRGARPLRSEG
jgi:hypothetical protein